MKQASVETTATSSPWSRRATRAVVVLYLTSLVLLPWAWFPPFPWLHEHAQWGDAVFAAAAVMWAIERWRFRLWPRLQAAHAGIALYFLCAALSLLFATPNPRAGIPKLLGVAELCILAFITSDLAVRPGVSRNITRTIAITSLVTAAAAVAGLLLFYSGISSPLIGIYGELEASRWYARVQAGTYNPNLLASFCIFAAAIVSRGDEALPPWLRRMVLAALWLSVLLTFSRGILGFIASAAIRNARTPARKKVAAATAVACVVLVISATVWKPKVDPSRPLETRFEQHPSSRLQAAKSSLLTLVAHPLFGSGLNTSPGIYQGAPFDAHFTLLNIAATLGLPALIAFSFLIGALWRSRRRPTDLAVWGGLAGLAVDALAQDVEDFRHVWLMIGTADAETRAKRIEATD
ncbi:MAG TPA: O-antigen ligase family protein [Blastocatellia bacterium]